MNKRIAIIPIGDAGQKTAARLQQHLEATATAPSSLPPEGEVVILCREAVAAHWHDFDAFVFIGAMGICVRTIAPFVTDKHTDPAVVCVDSLGKNVISVLSGHIGGANDLTRQIADILGAAPVITTQSDNSGLWPLDTLHRRFNWAVTAPRSSVSGVSPAPRSSTPGASPAPRSSVSGGSPAPCSSVSGGFPAGVPYLNPCIFPFVNRQPTALFLKSDDEGTRYLLRTLPSHVTLVNSLDEVDASRYKLLIIVSPYNEASPAGIPTLQYIPKVATVGFGLAHQAQPAEAIYEEIQQALTSHPSFLASRLSPLACQWSTIDVKADEPFVKMLEAHGETVRFFTAEELAAVDVPNPSPTVQKHVGTPSVCEAAAILASGHGQLVIPKIKGKNWTAALAASSIPAPSSQGADGGDSAFIEIVGAGPGDPDLISVRGRRMLEQADLILYAGSLVPRELTDCHKPGAVVRSSADMTLEEQCALMKEHYDRGHFIVRLHTGDPCIFGAIQEQMAFFDREGMRYHITPGISSFLAAAAELRSQFTIPERTQTIILTRGEGRTPMPEREKLHLLARSQSTMCIFLSAAIVDDVQAQLLQEYPEDTPVAACYHLTWPDQRIYRGQLKDLARIVHDNHLTLTTMLVVGEAIDNRRGLSELYSRHFTHLFRRGEDHL